MSKAKAPRVFVPLMKVDEEQRLVYGRMTEEILDKSGEMMDYATSKPHFEKWSNEISEASGGLSKGNLRVMHGLAVAGKVTEMEFNDDDKAIDICCKVVDDAEWNKVLEGCYTGFSVGGKYEKRWTDNGVKKFTAGPNEVSLVDNPCVPTASFTMIKADGAEEQVLFKAVPEEPETPAEEPAADPNVNDIAKGAEPTNDQVVARATEMAKAANDGTTWMQHVEAARDLLIKEAGSVEASGEETSEELPAGQDADDASADEGTDVSKTAGTDARDRLSQVWKTSDGQTFDKKADAEAHEETLNKAEPTEAEKLKLRMEKALNPTVEADPELMEDFDRLAKVFDALSTPFENGAPKLEKGMYTVNRFSNMLSDLGSLVKCIKTEGTTEGGDESDTKISDSMQASLAALGKSFVAYATQQVTELLAGIDDEVVVSYYDYYYRAAQEDGEDRLAKDVCAVIDEYREPATERRDTLVKAFGIVTEVTTELTDELSPVMQKRFDELQAENTEFKKIATEAVDKIEELTKRVSAVEDQPLPRAPNPQNVAHREGDLNGFFKGETTEEGKVALLHNMLKSHGADALATELIKAAQRNPIQVMGR